MAEGGGTNLPGGAKAGQQESGLATPGSRSSFTSMRHRDVPILLSLALLGCSGEADPSTDAQATDPQRSELVLQAVDAGTGAALTDGQLTVRYLVRTPITLDASAVDQVSASEPYRIVHAVAEERDGGRSHPSSSS